MNARRYANVDELVAAAVEDCIDFGATVSPKGNATLEVLNWCGQLTKPRARLLKNPERDIRTGYAVAKLAWDLAESDDPDQILWWNPNGEWYVDEVRNTGTLEKERKFWGESYGKRSMPYLRAQLEVLKKDPESRRVWVPIWQPHDAIYEPYQDFGGYIQPSLSFKNVPCCLGYQLRLRSTAKEHDALDMLVVMRSQSVGVLPYDVFLLSSLQELIANELGVGLGNLYWNALSMHVYDRELEQRKKELQWQRRAYVAGPRGFDYDTVRLIQREMQPIPYRLDEARDRWRITKEAVEKGVFIKPDEAGPYYDEFELMMVEGRPREAVQVIE